MTTRDDALRAVRRYSQAFQGAREIQRAVLGHPDGSTVRVTERPDLVYVRLKAKGDALWKVFNDKVGDDWGLPVLIEKRPVGNMWEVIDVDKEGLVNVGSGWDGSSRTPNHANRHEWPDGVPGEDPVNIHERALVPLRSYSRTYSGTVIRVAPYRYTYGGELKFYGGGEADLSGYVPSAGQSRWVMTYVDPRNNTLYVNPGPVTTYSPAIIMTKPDMPPYAIPSALVRLYGGQNYIVENDISDYRIILGMNVPDQAGGVKNASFVVMSYDAVLTDERLLTVGPGLSLADGGAGGAAHISIATSYAPQTPAYVTLTYSADLPNERMLVAGSNITLTDQGPGAGVVIASTGGGGGAPTDAFYLVLDYDGDLSGERKLSLVTPLVATDGGANSTYQVDVSLASLSEKTTTDVDDIYLLEDAGGDKYVQRYDYLMQEAFQRAWFYGGA